MVGREMTEAEALGPFMTGVRSHAFQQEQEQFVLSRNSLYIYPNAIISPCERDVYGPLSISEPTEGVDGGFAVEVGPVGSEEPSAEDASKPLPTSPLPVGESVPSCMYLAPFPASCFFLALLRMTSHATVTEMSSRPTKPPTAPPTAGPTIEGELPLPLLSPAGAAA